jgi:hypothetical protein
MQMSREVFGKLLKEFADWLVYYDCEPVEWVVCGGMALSLQGLRFRPTRDVDVLADWKPADGEIACIGEFPAGVRRCIKKVVDNHPELDGLAEGWINLGPQRLARWGLPEGFEQRMTTVRLGDRLTLHLLGRDDLLALKLYAAADVFGDRQDVHCDDLRALNPTFAELDKAVDWIRKLPHFEMRQMELKEVVRDLGYDDLAYYI